MLSEKNLEKIFTKEFSECFWINTLNKDSIIVLSGSSSVKYSLSCSLLNELSSHKYQFVNIAEDARDPMVTYFILKNLNLKKISAVYFGMDPWIYTKRYYKHRNNYLYSDFSFAESINYQKEQDNSTLLKRYKSIFSLFLSETNKNSKKNLPIPEDFGSVPLNKTAENFNQLPDEWFELDKYEWSDIQFIYLKKIIDLCKINKIKFFMFVPPKRSDFTIAYKSNCKKIHKEFVDKLAKENIDAPIFGKFNTLESIGDSAYFADACHLNEKGQKKYSELFYLSTLSKIQLFSVKYNWLSE